MFNKIFKKLNLKKSKNNNNKYKRKDLQTNNKKKINCEIYGGSFQ